MNNLVFSNFLHRPARTLVSITGIAIGVLLIIFTIGMANGSLRDRYKRAANVGAEIILAYNGAGLLSSDTFFFPITAKDTIKNIEGVDAAVTIGQNTVKATDNKTGSNTGSRRIDGIVFDEYSPVVGISIVEGETLPTKGDVVIIDTAFQRQRSLKVGDIIPIYERDFTIVGTYEPAAGARVKMPLSTMQSQLGGEGKVSSFLIKVKPDFTPEQVAEKVQNKFPENKVLLTSELEGLFMQGFPALNVFLNVVIGIAAIISALVILLTMYTTVTERTRQIGIMKSLGMSNKNISWIIAQEALLISFCGIVGGVLLTFLLRLTITSFLVIEVEIKPFTVLITLVVGLAGGALGALYPALRASKMDAVDALNYE